MVWFHRNPQVYMQVNLPSAGGSPSISPSPPQGGEKSYLTVSDWVNYLTSEKFGVMSTVLNVGALLIALVVLIYSVSTTHALWAEICNAVVVVLLAAYLSMTIFRPFERRGKKAERILKDVMTGKLSEECIRREWSKETGTKKAGRNIS